MRRVVRFTPADLDALRPADIDDERWRRLIYPYVTPLVSIVEYRRLTILLRAIPAAPDARVLDAGTGFGALLPSLAGSFNAIHAIDVQPSLASAARSLVESRRLTNASVTAGDLTALAFPDASFDAVVAANVLEHLDDRALDRALGEIRRVLRPGAALCCCSPSENALYATLRVVARKTKPPDHHQTARSIRLAVERHLEPLTVRNIPAAPDELSLFQIVIAARR
jgi:ubiquinone/menaquinone biosynthesis C-methylase UbiE